MRNGYSKLDMPSTLTTHFLLRNLYTTTVADGTTEAYALELTTVALVIFDWTEDSLAKESVTYWLVCFIVKSIRIRNLSM